MNENIYINIKSDWFNNGTIAKVGIEQLWVYLNIRKFAMQYSNNTCIFSLDLLHKKIQSYYGTTNNRIYSKPILKDMIINLKKNKLISYDRKYTITSNTDLIYCKLLDLPNLEMIKNKEGKYDAKPVTDDDKWLMIDEDTIHKIFNSGLNEKHLFTYYCIKKYVNTLGKVNGQITISYRKIGEYLNISKDSANKYAIELEGKYLIGNEYAKSQKGHKCNNFHIATNKNDFDSKSFEEVAEKNNVKRLKKSLKNRGIKVTDKAFKDIAKELENLNEKEKEKLHELEQKHICYAIDYVYRELLDTLKERMVDKAQHLDGVVKETIEANTEEIIEKVDMDELEVEANSINNNEDDNWGGEPPQKDVDDEEDDETNFGLSVLDDIDENDDGLIEDKPKNPLYNNDVKDQQKTIDAMMSGRKRPVWYSKN